MSLKRRSRDAEPEGPAKVLKEIQHVAASAVLANYGCGNRLYLNDNLFIEHNIDEDGYEIIAAALNMHFFGRINIDGGAIIDCDDIEEISEKVLELMESAEKEAVTG